MPSCFIGEREMSQWHIAYGRTYPIHAPWSRFVSACSIVSALICVHTLCTPPTTAREANQKQADFNGDGYTDRIIEESSEGRPFFLSRGTIPLSHAGGVPVVYGSSNRFGYGRIQRLSPARESTNCAYPPASDAPCRTAWTWGDFNKDGYDDLAIGIPGSRSYQGSVAIYFGSANGLSFRAAQILTNEPNRGLPLAATYDAFGTMLTAADVNNDGYSDLIIGVRNGPQNEGMVTVFLGRRQGLAWSRNPVVMPSFQKVAATSENEDGSRVL